MDDGNIDNGTCITGSGSSKIAGFEGSGYLGYTKSGQISSRPHTSFGPPKGSFLEGKWDPENFREI